MSVLQAEFLAKSYKSRKVVSDVSLTVNSNEIVGLLGPNGAGKTTTFLHGRRFSASRSGKNHH